MLIVRAIKTEKGIKEGEEYKFGALIHNSNKVLLLDKNKHRVSGVYNCKTCFGITREEILKRIKNENINT